MLRYYIYMQDSLHRIEIWSGCF